MGAWGEQGLREGAFLRPRAIGVLEEEVYVVDTTGRVQVFGPAGAFLRSWALPDTDNGTPTAIAFDAAGTVLIPDTHNSRILEFDPAGGLLRSWGGYGAGPDAFIYPTGIAHGPDGHYYISEYGENAERVHVFDAERKFVREWGGHGAGPGQFNRAMALVIGADATIYVSDMANHRIQRFDLTGALLGIINAKGTAALELKFPFDVAPAPDGSLLIAEYGANRISRFTPGGEFKGAYGGPGRQPGQFDAPRGVAVSGSGTVYVADTDNHRIQFFSLHDPPGPLASAPRDRPAFDGRGRA